MEGNGGGSWTATPAWDLGIHWGSAGSSAGYPQRSSGAGLSHDHHDQEQEHTWLNLGKRPCCWAAAEGSQAPQLGSGVVHGNNGGGSGTAAAESKRKDKAAAAVPRCQVEGCHVSLSVAKEYHRRHKVCEAHSKAPRVVVLGAEQRFCQQCSRSVVYKLALPSLSLCDFVPLWCVCDACHEYTLIFFVSVKQFPRGLGVRRREAQLPASPGGAQRAAAQEQRQQRGHGQERRAPTTRYVRLRRPCPSLLALPHTYITTTKMLYSISYKVIFRIDQFSRYYS
jgi:hypothetical protein